MNTDKIDLEIQQCDQLLVAYSHKLNNVIIKLVGLIATDVASRGLDIEDVTYIINYGVLSTYEDYIHRIKRTELAGKREIALISID